MAKFASLRTVSVAFSRLKLRPREGRGLEHAGEEQRRGHRLANWFLNHRAITILIVLVPSLLLAYALPKIEVYSRFADLLPAEHGYIKNYNRMKQTFGGANVVTMSLEVTGEGDIFTLETLNKIKHLTEEVDIIQGVNHYQVASIAHPKIRRIRTTSGGMIKSEPILPRKFRRIPTTSRNCARKPSTTTSFTAPTFRRTAGRP